jgi:hypothetical protein
MHPTDTHGQNAPDTSGEVSWPELGPDIIGSYAAMTASGWAHQCQPAMSLMRNRTEQGFCMCVTTDYLISILDNLCPQCQLVSDSIPLLFWRRCARTIPSPTADVP